MPPAGFGLPSNPRGRVGTSPFPTSAKPSIAQPMPRNPGEYRSDRSVTSPQPRLSSRQNQDAQPQRSVRSPPQPAQRSRVGDPYGEEYTPRLSRESDSSTGSSSSSGSSIWARDTTSQRSSKTTLQSYDGDSGYKEVTQSSIKEPIDDASTFNVDTGHVWSRVTEAASVITGGVGKVLASYSAHDEQEDDNHLTSVLRAYHLAKAASPSDLPDWLFTERERHLPGSHQSGPHSISQGRDDRLAQDTDMRYRRGVARTQDSGRTFERPSVPSYHRESPPTSQSRAFGDRLRDIRKVPGASASLTMRR